ncbi:hypothetical protein [Salinisphaera hydrothermalis]|uniref:hypothetical protein n=1 Tax=Salinisphaera hydrothermalis TaxID=563188 RepID=UPI00333FF4BD
MARLLVFVLFLLAASAAFAGAAHELPAGAGQYVYHDTATDKNITVFYYKPRNYKPDMPVVFVLHGLRRNAAEYRDSWIGPAEQNGLMVLVPLFKRDPYRGSNGYNLGNVFHATTHREAIGRAKPDTLNPKSLWAFTLVGRVFDDFRHNRQTTERTSYDLYGHGAGAQFAHRFAMFMPQARVDHIIVGAAGWYTVPDRQVNWPYGIADVPQITDADLKTYLGRHVLILIGGADNRRRNTIMRQNRYANAQGDTRVARSLYEFQYAKRLAKRLDTPFNWQRWVIPGVTHTPAQMTPFAASYFAAVAD